MSDFKPTLFIYLEKSSLILINVSIRLSFIITTEKTGGIL
jgi:hypothetical protein